VKIVANLKKNLEMQFSFKYKLIWKENISSSLSKKIEIINYKKQKK